MRNFIANIFIVLLFQTFSYASVMDEAFITTQEYGQMLYNNPRGIGCNKCHGDDAKGMHLGEYTNSKKVRIQINAPDITNVSFNEFQKKLNSLNVKKSLIMPTYFLTNSELKSLYMYITSKNKKAIQ